MRNQIKNQIFQKTLCNLCFYPKTLVRIQHLILGPKKPIFKCQELGAHKSEQSKQEKTGFSGFRVCGFLGVSQRRRGDLKCTGNHANMKLSKCHLQKSHVLRKKTRLQERHRWKALGEAITYAKPKLLYLFYGKSYAATNGFENA